MPFREYIPFNIETKTSLEQESAIPRKAEVSGSWKQRLDDIIPWGG